MKDHPSSNISPPRSGKRVRTLTATALAVLMLGTSTWLAGSLSMPILNPAYWDNNWVRETEWNVYELIHSGSLVTRRIVRWAPRYEDRDYSVTFWNLPTLSSLPRPWFQASWSSVGQKFYLSPPTRRSQSMWPWTVVRTLPYDINHDLSLVSHGWVFQVSPMRRSLQGTGNLRYIISDQPGEGINRWEFWIASDAHNTIRFARRNGSTIWQLKETWKRAPGDEDPAILSGFIF